MGCDCAWDETVHRADSLHLVPFIGFPFLCKVRFVSVCNVKKCRKRQKLSKTVKHVKPGSFWRLTVTIWATWKIILQFLVAPIFDRSTHFCKNGQVGGGSPGIICKTHSYYISQMEATLKILGRPHFWPLNPFLQKREWGVGWGSPGIILKTHSYYITSKNVRSRSGDFGKLDLFKKIVLKYVLNCNCK